MQFDVRRQHIPKRAANAAQQTLSTDHASCSIRKNTLDVSLVTPVANSASLLGRPSDVEGHEPGCRGVCG